MSRRPLLLLAAALTALAALPAVASAAILDVRIETTPSPSLCVTTNAPASSVGVVVGRPGGGSLATVVSTDPQGTQCDGGAGRSFRPALPFTGPDGAVGATLAITDSTGDAVTVPWPLASLETGSNGVRARLHLRNLPTAAGTQIGNGSSLPATGATAGAYDSPAEITTPGAPITVTATIGGTPFRAVITPRAFTAGAAAAAGKTALTIDGADPNGGRVAIALTAPDGSVIARTSALPRVGGGLQVKAALPLMPAPGSTVAATQGSWSTSTRFGVAALTPDGFTVSIPDPPGCVPQQTCPSGAYSYEFQLEDPARIDLAGSCRALGANVSAAPGCAAFSGERTLVNNTEELPVAGDKITIALTDASLGTTNLEVVAAGARGSLDDGSLSVFGAPRQPVMAAISSPRGALPPLRTSRTVLTSSAGAALLGPERDAFPLRVADGATVTLSGSGAGSVPLAYQYRLAAAVTGVVITGTAAPGARVVVTQRQGAREDGHLTFASASGAFAVSLDDPSPGDLIEVAAGDPATRGLTTLSLIVDGFAPRIAGIVDQQPVRAGAVASVTGLPSGTSVVWGGDLPQTIGGTSLPLPIDRLSDGPARVTATALDGPSSTDYLYVLVDATAPTGGAGPDQTVPVGRRAVFVTQARDANGLAAVRFQFKAGGSGVGQPVNQLGQPFRHVFTKVGTYAVTVTITDLAGNTTSDRAIVRVVKSLASAVSGRWPGRVTRRAGLKPKLSARVPGDLSIQIFRPSGKLAVMRTVSFDKARVGKKLTIVLKRFSRGRYLAVRQFVDANGVAGPVVATPLVIA